MPKSSNLGGLGGDQDVGRLDVAVNDQILVRILDGCADLLEQVHRTRTSSPAVAVCGRGGCRRCIPSPDTARHLARPPSSSGRCSGVEGGEDLPLGAKATRKALAVHQRPPMSFTATCC